MKTLNTVLSVVLLVAVIFLFVREFGDNDTSSKSTKPGKEEVETALEGQSASGARLAYVNSDTLYQNYDYYNELSGELEEKSKSLEQELARISEGFQSNVQALQQQANNLNPQQLQEAQMELQQKQQELQMYADRRTRDLENERRKLDSLLMVDMNAVLDDIEEEYSLDYIFRYSRQSSLLSVNDAFNITDIVVEKLNESNKLKKEEKAKEEKK